MHNLAGVAFMAVIQAKVPANNIELLTQPFCKRRAKK
jgi:hypothetical protein